jgi:DNA invertase Pin-like site-specific DNA recombinase
VAKTIRKLQHPPALQPKKKRVAAYARVSSGKDAMLHSLSTQVSYYSKFIQNHPDWEFAGIYADEAQTGTKDTRPEFQRLLDDCRARQIDMVITKSISRFARNTLTLLQTTRELKDLGIDIFFEEQNIHTISGTGEMILTLLASVAQEESRATSDNCKWRIRSQFKKGELVNLRFMYGYTIDKGVVIVNDDEAAIVRSIFIDYLNGRGCGQIAKELRQKGIPGFGNGVWTPKRVLDILKNEKYTGNALLQKKYVVDHLTKKEVRNKGVLAKFFAVATHPAIIDQVIFDQAQLLIEANRKKNKAGDRTGTDYPFSGLITCGQCGKHYRRKISKGKPYWICATFNHLGKEACPSKQIPEDTLYHLACGVLNLQSFNEDTFKRQIAAMFIPSPNRVRYTFTDGTEVIAEWQARSRSKSWTDEMRKQARERAIQNRRKV